MDVKDIIKYNRVRLNMTMKELADKVGVSEATISRWESGEISNMKRSGMIALAEALNVSPSDLMGWDEVEGVSQKIHYLDPEVADIAQELYERPELKTLFSTTRKVSKEDLEVISKLIDKFADDKE